LIPTLVGAINPTKLIDVKEESPWNTEKLMVVTLAGIVIDTRLVLYSNN
jgi:hypothetical protein